MLVAVGGERIALAGVLTFFCVRLLLLLLLLFLVLLLGVFTTSNVYVSAGALRTSFFNSLKKSSYDANDSMRRRRLLMEMPSDVDQNLLPSAVWVLGKLQHELDRVPQ